jgi:N-acetyl sugar amidotransferase
MPDPYQICKRCVMESSEKDFLIYADGTCNYCNEFISLTTSIISNDTTQLLEKRNKFVQSVRLSGKGKRYDCVIGVSGGVDSSWALVQAVKSGLKPLAVHMDNGWNSELAQHNIANLVRTLGVDLYTHVIDWGEYRELMQAFFDADVIDIELLYDNAMLATNFQQAAKYNVNYILAGTNLSTEGMRIPESWNWFKYDKRNIKAIAKQFRNAKLKTFPAIGTFGRMWHEVVRQRKWVSFLNYFDYNKNDALEELTRDYGYKPYLYKHYESIFTRFYQGYILPKKFGVDKRRHHLSTLIISKQMLRDEALKLLDCIPYPSEKELEEDRDYFLKKMGWSLLQFEHYLNRPEKSHSIYASEKKLYNYLCSFYKKRIQI